MLNNSASISPESVLVYKWNSHFKIQLSFDRTSNVWHSIFPVILYFTLTLWHSVN